MGTSKVIRQNKDYVKEYTPPLPKKTRSEKVIDAIIECGGKATFVEICEKVPIDRGNLWNVVNKMVDQKILIKKSCEHCHATDLYYTK